MQLCYYRIQPSSSRLVLTLYLIVSLQVGGIGFDEGLCRHIPHVAGCVRHVDHSGNDISDGSHCARPPTTH